MSSNKKFSTFIEVIQYQAERQPDKPAYIFLQDGEKDELRITYRELDRQARSIAAVLQEQCKPGDRALLLYNPGIEFIPAFIGCLYANIIAVPLLPPNSAKLDIRMEKIIAIYSDAKPSAVLTTRQILDRTDTIIKTYPELKKAGWIASDKVRQNIGRDWIIPSVRQESIAFLQYTSGSTSDPKGVMVSHKNILYNEEMMRNAINLTDKAVWVSWLPFFHDMGLIAGILHPFYIGMSCVQMSPAAFIKKPIRWLEAISRYEATVSGGPNFAYDLCAGKVTDESMENLDLNSWDIAFTGSEPVRADTITNFTDRFKACGFHKKSFYPCYGMAEATLFVTGGATAAEPIICNADKTELKENKLFPKENNDEMTRKIVGCGHSWLDEKIRIVNHESGALCNEGEIGEIWISGDNVAQGYWEKTKETEETFQAFIQNTGEGPFLRTGDLGFMINDELFINGRLKDLIIISGCNFYPHDIENTVSKIHPSLRQDYCSVFSVDLENEEKLVIVQEILKKYEIGINTDDIIENIIKDVSLYHEINTYAVVLIRQGTLPKTSSGKVQRGKCRALFLEGKLNTVAVKILSADTSSVSVNLKPPGTITNESIEDWLVLMISQIASIDPGMIELSNSVFDYGLNSKQILFLNGEIEKIFGIEIPPTVFIDNPTISGIAGHLVNNFINV